MLKICAIDLDGVLVDYPKCFVNWVNGILHKDFKNLQEIKDSLSYKKYKEIKYNYRTSGIKAILPAIENATYLTQELRKKDFTIIILTSRPIYEIPEVFRDTLYWLKNNNIAYDLIFAAKDKHIKIIKYFSDLKFIIEDNSEIANNVAKHNFKVYLLNNLYNQTELHKKVKRINELIEVLEYETKS